MFIVADSSHTLRYHPAEGDNFLLVGGEGHMAGHGGDTVVRYQRIEAWARERFSVESVNYHWSTQDNNTLDGVPYVGRTTPLSEHVYVATGFAGWGMTNSTAAAMLLRDLTWIARISGPTSMTRTALASRMCPSYSNRRPESRAISLAIGNGCRPGKRGAGRRQDR